MRPPEAVAARRRRCARVLPIENSTAGSVHEVYDLLFRSNLAIVGEEVVEVEHCLLGVPGATRRGPDPACIRIRRRWRSAASSWRSSRTVETEAGGQHRAGGRARGAELADPTRPRLPARKPATASGCVVLRRNIANQALNFTRFVVVAAIPRGLRPAASQAKVSLVFGTKHERGRPGPLPERRCGRGGLSLTKLESRPRPGMAWEYVLLRRRRGPRGRAADAVGAGRPGGGDAVRAGAGLLSARRDCPRRVLGRGIIGSFMQRTFAIIKPDAVRAGATGAILARIEAAGFHASARCG